MRISLHGIKRLFYFFSFFIIFVFTEFNQSSTRMVLSVVIKEILFNIFGNLAAAPIQNLLGNVMKNSPNGSRYSRSKVMECPTLIMGDRGKPDNGFRQELYLRRDVDFMLQDNFRKNGQKERKHNIVLITGRPTSGKSRVVWEFLCSEAGSPYKSVFIPNESANDEELKKELFRLSLPTLIVFDDIDLLWDTQSISASSLLEILSGINDRGQSCIITLSHTTPCYNELYNLITNDNALGRQKTKSVLKLEIEDIQREDETYYWCTANFALGNYSKVIGGYILELSRHFEININSFLSEPAALLYLTAFIILQRFRNRQYVEVNRINLLYQTIREKEHLSDLPEEPDSGNTKILFDTGILNCRNRNGSIVNVIDDESLYEAFTDFCVSSRGSGRSTVSTIINHYLSDTKAAENNQIFRLLEMNHGEDPTIYSRIITRSHYQEHQNNVTEWFIKKFFDNHDSGIKLKPNVSSDPREICFTASIIIGRASDPIRRCQEFVDAGITPDINIVDELIRSSLLHKTPSEKKSIIQYALELKATRQLTENMYYFKVLESSQSEYDRNRLSNAIALYRREIENNNLEQEEAENLQASFDGYCQVMTLKADSQERMNQYFQLIRDYPELVLERAALKKLVYKIAGKAGAASSALFQQLADAILECDADIIDEETQNIGLISIMRKCPDISVGLRIYDSIFSRLQETMQIEMRNDYQRKDKLLNIMSFRLANKMRFLNLSDPTYARIQNILKERLHSACVNNDFGVAQKIFNIILNNQPRIPVDKATDNIIKLYNDENLLAGKRNIDNLNSAFHCALEANKDDLTKDRNERCKSLMNLAFTFDKIRTEAGLAADGRYKVFLFKILETIQYIDIDKTIPVDQLLQLIDFQPGIEDVSEESLRKEEILWGQVILMTDDVELLKRIAGTCLTLVQNRSIVLRNILNHLYSAFCNRFQNNRELEQLLQELENRTYKSVMHDIYDYLHYLKFDIQTGKLRSIKDVEKRIDEAWTKLQHTNSPLRMPRADLICSTISLYSFKEAIDLVCFAIDYDRNRRYRATPILSLDILTELIKRFKTEVEENRSEDNRDLFFGYAKEIQNIIYSMDSIEDGFKDKNFTFRHIKNPVDKPLERIYGHRRDFTRIPVESDNQDIRRTAFLKRVDEDGIAHCSAYEIECFLYQELHFANSCIFQDIRKNTKGSIDDFIEYILFAIESSIAAGMNLNFKKMNQERFCSKFARQSRWQSYDNFFEGYLYERYVPENLSDRWREVSEKCGLSIPVHVFLSQESGQAG